MGLDIRIKGLEGNTYHGSYSSFGAYRICVAIAFNQRIGELYKKSSYTELNTEEIDEWNCLCNEDLDLFLWHSDCDGEIKSKQCKKIYNVLKDIHVQKEYKDIHQLWIKMFKYCYKQKKTMYFD
ncbi:MAG: hypothetical protein IJH12_06995 [Clostridia bacterium]|nr:hypothetical protein [Clostridia bacterium]